VAEDIDSPEVDRDLVRHMRLSEAALSALSSVEGSDLQTTNWQGVSFTLEKTEKNAAVWIFARPGGEDGGGGFVHLSKDDRSDKWAVTATGGTDFSTKTWDDRAEDLAAWSWSVNFPDFDPSLGAAAAYGRLPQSGSEVEFGFGFVDRLRTVTSDDAGRFLVLVDVTEDQAEAFRSFRDMRQDSPNPLLRIRTPNDRTFDLRNGWSVTEVR
jgi:hypothetical protein